MPNSSLFSFEVVNRGSVGDLEDLQRELARLQLELDPGAGLGDTLGLAAGMLHRTATGIVHVDTGRYKNSLFWDVDRSERSPSAIMGTNLAYSIHEERRGGSHATFERTGRMEGPNVERLFGTRIRGDNA